MGLRLEMTQKLQLLQNAVAEGSQVLWTCYPDSLGVGGANGYLPEGLLGGHTPPVELPSP